jgi:hypothetical protein
MDKETRSRRYRAASMELAAYLDDQYVEMHITTDSGEMLTVVCPRDSIFAIQRHIEKIGHDCPEIAGWSRPDHHHATAQLSAGRAHRPHFHDEDRFA